MRKIVLLSPTRKLQCKATITSLGVIANLDNTQGQTQAGRQNGETEKYVSNKKVKGNPQKKKEMKWKQPGHQTQIAECTGNTIYSLQQEYETPLGRMQTNIKITASACGGGEDWQWGWESGKGSHQVLFPQDVQKGTRSTDVNTSTCAVLWTVRDHCFHL